MPRLTVDVNIVLIWLGFQSGLLKTRATEIFGELVRGNLEVAAPDFLLVELINVLKWRFKRSEKELYEIIKRVVGSGMRFVPVGVGEMQGLNSLMHKHELTAYDAQYLYVAQKTESKLITLDPKLLEVKKWCVGLGEI